MFRACLIALLLTIGGACLPRSVQGSTSASQLPWWDFQAIDTMKYSRDPSREFLSRPDELRRVSSEQITQIAQTGATHVGIATPYDEEFLPILKEWVTQARQAGLHIWFRGNWAGWESWFGYPRITRQEHLDKTVAFIRQHPELFEDGDIFSACPECENGGPGDPRLNGDAVGHRQFLIDEYQAMNQAFRDINRNVQTNYNSMNGDVARLIMDKPTTQALGGLVVVDHYVRTPEKLNDDVTDFAQRSGGKVILGEFGAPIPDINGQMTQQEQAVWLDQSLQLLVQNPNLVGLSYWTNIGGSTAIWTDEGDPKPAVAVLTSYYKPAFFSGKVLNDIGQPLSAVEITVENRKHITGKDGQYAMAYRSSSASVSFSSPGYHSLEMNVSQLSQSGSIELERKNPSLWYRLRRLLYHWLT